MFKLRPSCDSILAGFGRALLNELGNQVQARVGNGVAHWGLMENAGGLPAPGKWKAPGRAGPCIDSFI